VAKLLELDLDKYTARIKMTTGEGKGTVLEAVEYEDLCKVRIVRPLNAIAFHLTSAMHVFS
jgi:hypothetical protein